MRLSFENYYNYFNEYRFGFLHAECIGMRSSDPMESFPL